MEREQLALVNSRSYFRDAKNYTSTVTEILNKQLSNHKFKKDDIEFTFTKISKMTGEVGPSLNEGSSQYQKGQADPLLRI